MNDVRSSEEPMDRLTRLSAEMTKVLDDPENADVRAIVLLDDETGGGVQLYNWADENEAMAHLFMHMKAVFQSVGKDLDFIGIPDSPEGVNG